MRKLTMSGGTSVSGSLYTEGHPHAHAKACKISENRNLNSHPNASHDD